MSTKAIVSSTIPLTEKQKECQEGFAYIFQAYKMVNEDEVIPFVKKHLFLLPILVEAPREIYCIFPRDDINLELELHHDPEEDYDELFVIIKSPYAPQKARQLMDKLDGWFLNVMKHTRNKLCLTEEPL